MVATADSEEETKEVPEKTPEEKPEEALKEEVADMKKMVSAIAKKMELQDGNIPEFGGTNSNKPVEVADMTADQRAQEFGDYGKYDAIFNGADSASRFKR